MKRRWEMEGKKKKGKRKKEKRKKEKKGKRKKGKKEKKEKGKKEKKEKGKNEKNEKMKKKERKQDSSIQVLKVNQHLFLMFQSLVHSYLVVRSQILIVLPLIAAIDTFFLVPF